MSNNLTDERLDQYANDPLMCISDEVREMARELRERRCDASQSVSNGWKLVPVDPTENMIIAGFESEPDEFFSKAEEWEAYQNMSGCRQAAHRAKLCWSAMLAAAPSMT